MTQILHNGKIIFSENPDAFLPIGRTIRTSNDITLYHNKLPDDKFGYTEVDKYELMAQYAGRSKSVV